MTHDWHGVKGLDRDGSSLWYKGINFSTDDIYDYAAENIENVIDEYKTISASIAALIECGELPENKYEAYIKELNEIESPYDIIHHISDDWINCNVETIQGFLDDLIIAKQNKKQFSEMKNEAELYLDKIIENSICVLDDGKEMIYHSREAVQRAKNVINGTAYIITVQNDACCVCSDNEELIKRLTEMSEKYSPCSAIVMNTEGQVVCQGILNDEFIKLTINQINKPVKKMNFEKNIDR